MDRLIFTSNATINQMANARQVLVNELANVSTVGFKSSYDVALQSVKAISRSRPVAMMAPGCSRIRSRVTACAWMRESKLVLPPSALMDLSATS